MSVAGGSNGRGAAGPQVALARAAPLPAEPARRAWDRIDGESNPAWAAFVTYRDLQLERTHQRVLAALHRPAGYRRQLEEWHGRHRWNERCRAYDDFVDGERQRLRLQMEAQEIERHRGEFREMLDIHLQAGRALFIEGLQKLVGNGNPDPRLNGKIEILTARTALSVAQFGVELERLTRGLATQRVDEKVNVAKTTLIEFGDDDASYARGLGALAAFLERQAKGTPDPD